jgi:hypothetical protein
VDARFPMKFSANDFRGKIPMGFNPTNQTITIGKFPKDLNSPKSLCKSFESKMPLFVLDFCSLLYNIKADVGNFLTVYCKNQCLLPYICKSLQLTDLGNCWMAVMR